MKERYSTEQDLNQRPRYFCYCLQSTVSSSTNRAIGGWQVNMQ